MSEFDFRSAYDGKELLVSNATSLFCDPEEDMTQQQFAEDADINRIIERFGVTGQLPQPQVEPFFGDFSEVGDYQSAIEQLRAMDDSFMTIPAEVRSRFQNDPGRFYEFVQDPANRRELAEMGLLRPELAQAILTPQEPAPVAPTGSQEP